MHYAVYMIQNCIVIHLHDNFRCNFNSQSCFTRLKLNNIAIQNKIYYTVKNNSNFLQTPNPFPHSLVTLTT
jgi:hypothetical protein